MKIKNKILMLTCTLIFTACENNINDNLLDSTVYLINSGEVTSNSFNESVGTFDYEGYVHCSGFYGADVAVNLAVDAAAVNTYNSANGTQLKVLPEACYTIVNNVVYIAKEERSARFSVRFNCAALRALGDLTNYVAPVTITTNGAIKIKSTMSTVYIKPKMVVI